MPHYQQIQQAPQQPQMFQMTQEQQQQMSQVLQALQNPQMLQILQQQVPQQQQFQQYVPQQQQLQQPPQQQQFPQVKEERSTPTTQVTSGFIPPPPTVPSGNTRSRTTQVQYAQPVQQHFTSSRQSSSSNAPSNTRSNIQELVSDIAAMDADFKTFIQDRYLDILQKHSIWLEPMCRDLSIDYEVPAPQCNDVPKTSKLHDNMVRYFMALGESLTKQKNPKTSKNYTKTELKITLRDLTRYNYNGSPFAELLKLAKNILALSNRRSIIQID
jgi:hypothetical protein